MLISNGTDGPRPSSLSEQDWQKLGLHFRLSARQLAVARLLFADQTRRAIASKLRLRPTTVRLHIDNLYRKFDVRDRLQLAKAILTWHFQSGAGKVPGHY